MKVLNKAFVNKIIDQLVNKQDIDETTSFNKAVQFIVFTLSKMNIPYKIYSLGAGVKRITTKDVDKCPCCGQKIS